MGPGFNLVFPSWEQAIARFFLGPTSAIRKSDFLASISLLLVRKSDLLVSISLLLVRKSDFLVSVSLLLVRKSDLLVSISLLLVSKSDFLVSILLLLVSKSDFLVADGLASFSDDPSTLRRTPTWPSARVRRQQVSLQKTSEGDLYANRCRPRKLRKTHTKAN